MTLDSVCIECGSYIPGGRVILYSKEAGIGTKCPICYTKGSPATLEELVELPGFKEYVKQLERRTEA